MRNLFFNKIIPMMIVLYFLFHIMKLYFKNQELEIEMEISKDEYLKDFEDVLKFMLYFHFI
jgi:hypothetical protein